jgi:hypothetical protein
MNGIRRFNARQLVNDGLLGQYSLGTSTGLIAAATTGELFQFRWPDSLRIAAIRKVTVNATLSTNFAAGPATPLQLDLVKATGWTVQGSGGTALDTTTGTCKRRTLMPTSLRTNGDVRAATTAALTAGTKTLDSQPLSTVNLAPLASLSTPLTALITSEDSDLDYPIVLAQNEGFVVRLTQNPGTGTFFLSVSVDWMETNAS